MAEASRTVERRDTMIALTGSYMLLWGCPFPLQRRIPAIAGASGCFLLFVDLHPWLLGRQPRGCPEQLTAEIKELLQCVYNIVHNLVRKRKDIKVSEEATTDG